ncbi:hypothetical protein [Undibacterium sp. Ren11W]|uniref:hypothetical protein n=1 Tax=Undibacterium sp. Ren11W TaxID=3413045 RepID=UPI003BF505DC
MDNQEKINKSNSVPARIVIVALLACLLCVTLFAFGTLNSDGVLHQIMSYWFGPYIITAVCFSVTFFAAQLFGFNMKLKNEGPQK